MEKAVSAADANRNFSKLLREVREGHSYLVTSHGRPVARVIPPETNGRVSRAARAALFKRLRAERVKDIGRWSREELYEDEP
jgi:prevent-host-death family protein